VKADLAVPIMTFEKGEIFVEVRVPAGSAISPLMGISVPSIVTVPSISIEFRPLTGWIRIKAAPALMGNGVGNKVVETEPVILIG
jgi:hypothetical protein